MGWAAIPFTPPHEGPSLFFITVLNKAEEKANYPGRRKHMTTDQEDMAYETSNVTSLKGFKPLFPKGYYAACLIGAKEYRDNDGNWIENKYGRQIILDFAVYYIKRDTDENGQQVGAGIVGKPVVVPWEGAQRDVTLSKFVNVMYKATKKDGKTPDLDEQGRQKYRTAITPDGRITKIFKALGWAGPESGKKLSPKEYLGNWVELNINDYELKDKEGQPTGKKASGIADIGKLEAAIPADLIPPKPTGQAVEKTVTSPGEQLQATEENVGEERPVSPEVKARLEQLKADLAEGIITQKGYDMAVQQLTKAGGSR